MFKNLTDLSLSPLNFVVRAALVYFAVVILLRISGKRMMGQMGATEFVVILLISNAVQNSMNGGDNSLLGGIILATVLIAISSLVTYLTYRSRFCSSLFEGTPTLLIHNGKVLAKNMVAERLNDYELHALLRKQGIHDFARIGTAILESDGTLSVTPLQPKVDVS